MVVGTRTIRWLSAANLAIVACGLAGCTSGPGIQTADTAASDSVVVVGDETEIATDEPSLGERWRELFKQPDWMRKLVDKEPASPDPFVAAAQARQKQSEFLIDYTPVHIEPVAYDVDAAKAGESSSVIHLDGQNPGWFADDATPVDPSGHHRDNPFVDGPVSGSGTQSTQWTDRTTAGSPVAAVEDDVVSLATYLSQSMAPSAGVVHRDMIVDSYLVPQSFDRQVRPISAEVTYHQPVGSDGSPSRRPFGEPDWNRSGSTPSASANQPVSVQPEIPRPAERVSFSSYRGRSERAPAFSGRESYREVESSPGDSVSPENPFAAVQDEDADSTRVPSDADQGSSTDASEADLPDNATEGTSAEAQVTDASPLANAIDLRAAKRLAEQESRNPTTPKIGTPTIVGLGLVAIAAGVVMIRGQLA